MTDGISGSDLNFVLQKMSGASQAQWDELLKSQQNSTTGASANNVVSQTSEDSLQEVSINETVNTNGNSEAQKVSDAYDRQIEKAKRQISDINRQMKQLDTKRNQLLSQLSGADVDISSVVSELNGVATSKNDLYFELVNLNYDINDMKTQKNIDIQSILENEASINQLQSNSLSAGTSASTNTTTTAANSNTSLPSDVAAKLDNKLGSGFSARLEQVAQNVNCSPQDLVGMMYSESGLNPSIGNSIGAVGLIGIMPSTAQANGYSTSQIASMNGVQQLDVVEKILLAEKKLAFGDNRRLSGGQLYAMNFLPAYANNANGILTQSGSTYYNTNSGLDLDKDGAITINDLQQRINTKYQEALKYM